MEKIKYKTDEKYVKRRTIATMLVFQILTITYVGIFIYGIMN